MEGTEKIVEFKAGMTCNGCANAVKRVLGKIEGVTEVQTDVESKQVLVHCADSVDSNQLLAALQKWGNASGKEVSLVAGSA